MSNEMKCTNEKMTWNTHDMNLSWYMSKANVDHTISGKGTAISTLDHMATTPRANTCDIFPNIYGWVMFCSIMASNNDHHLQNTELGINVPTSPFGTYTRGGYTCTTLVKQNQLQYMSIN